MIVRHASSQGEAGTPRSVLEVELPAIADSANPTLDSWLAASTDLSGCEPLCTMVKSLQISVVVAWITDPLAESPLPEEPVATRIPPDAGAQSPSRLLAGLLPELSRRLDPIGCVLFAGRRNATSITVLPLIELVDQEGIEQVQRLDRPGVDSVAWLDPDLFERQIRARPSAAYSSGSFLLRWTPTAARELQLELDAMALWCALHGRDCVESLVSLPGLVRWTELLRSTSAEVGEAAHWLALTLRSQSQMASRLSTACAPESLASVCPWTSRWLLPRPETHGGRTDLVHILDLLKSRFRADHPPALLGTLEATTGIHLLEEPQGPEVSGTFPAGFLTLPEQKASRDCVQRRLEAARLFGRFLVTGDPAEQRAALELLRQSIAELPLRFDALRQTLTGDVEILSSSVPLRVQAQKWQVAMRVGESWHQLGEFVSRITRDSRYGSLDAQLVRSVGGATFDPVAWCRSSEVELSFRTEVSLKGPRNARLEIQGATHTRIELNSEPLWDGMQADLLKALVLPTGLNQIRVVVRPDPESDSMSLLLELLPYRYEEQSLSPRHARKILEPMVKVEYPTALLGEVLIIPEGRDQKIEGEALAEFVHESRTDRWVDLWVRAQNRSEAQGSVFLEVDELAPMELELSLARQWQWLRLPEKVALTTGGHTLRVRVSGAGILVDTISILPTGPDFPRAPEGDLSLGEFAWRFDPLGTGHVLQLPPIEKDRPVARFFTPQETASYRIFLWIPGTTSLPAGEHAEVHLAAGNDEYRFIIHPGLPREEWLAMGSVVFALNETVRVQAVGPGDPGFIAFVQ